MQSSAKLEQVSEVWSHNTGDDASIPRTQKIPFLLHTCSRRMSFPQSYRILMSEKSTLLFMLALVYFIYVMLSFLQSQEYKSCYTIQTKGPSDQSSVPTVARDKCVGKSNRRKQTKSIWPSSPNALLKPPLFSGWGISWVRYNLFI